MDNLRAAARSARDRAAKLADAGDDAIFMADWTRLTETVRWLETAIADAALTAGRGPAGLNLNVAKTAALCAHAVLIDGQQGSAMEARETLFAVRLRLTEAASLIYLASQGGTVVGSG